MFFLLRVAFWLTIVLALLPTGSSQPGAQSQGRRHRRGGGRGRGGLRHERASATASREACVVGAQAAVAIGQRAQAGARMVYEFINDRVSHGETGSVIRAQGRGGARGAALAGLAEHAEARRPRSGLAGPAGPHRRVPLPRPRKDPHRKA